ncbi:unnamed protein product [Alternaria burnsii]|nr:unnamed protein product [Alternaria burnsii]
MIQFVTTSTFHRPERCCTSVLSHTASYKCLMHGMLQGRGAFPSKPCAPHCSLQPGDMNSAPHRTPPCSSPPLPFHFTMHTATRYTSRICREPSIMATVVQRQSCKPLCINGYSFAPYPRTDLL